MNTVAKHEVEDILSDVDTSKVEIVFLTTDSIVKDGQRYQVKHYPLDIEVEEESEIQSEIGEASKRFKSLIKSHITDHEAGTLYFAPRHSFADVNTEARPVYASSYKNEETGKYEIESETNFLFLPKN